MATPAEGRHSHTAGTSALNCCPMVYAVGIFSNRNQTQVNARLFCIAGFAHVELFDVPPRVLRTPGTLAFLPRAR